MEEREIKKVLDAVLEKYRIPEYVYEKLFFFMEEVKKELSEIIHSVYKSSKVSVELVGSIPRKTALNEEFDLDVFIVHPREWSFDYFSMFFEEAAREFYARYGVKPSVEYAAHPYFKGTIKKDFMEISVEVVPCFRWKRGQKVKSPVDRSVEHNAWLNNIYAANDHLRDLAVVLKVFFRSIGVYGAEARVSGFSGYLTELLAVYYKNFLRAIKAMSSWKPYSVILSLKEVGSKGTHKLIKEKSPMLFLDPVDPERNVAAAVGKNAIEIVSRASKRVLSLLKEGNLRDLSRFFSLEYDERLIDEYIRKLYEMELQDLFALIFPEELLSYHPDIIYTELQRSAEGLKTKLMDLGINVEYLVDHKRVMILFRVIKQGDGSRIRKGPHGSMRDHEINFLKKNLSKKNALLIAFINERWYILEKVFSDIMAALRIALQEASHGKDIRKYVEKGDYRIVLGRYLMDEIVSMDVEEKAKFLMFYLDLDPWEVRRPWNMS
ncbi:MAG: nucleotidyltransferase domain-containing protein [Euryarchaeota archaeon]|nr:nucleotidyltransferase domain-containing protein [Euryarchaeota archaeon]